MNGVIGLCLATVRKDQGILRERAGKEDLDVRGFMGSNEIDVFSCMLRIGDWAVLDGVFSTFLSSSISPEETYLRGYADAY